MKAKTGTARLSYVEGKPKKTRQGNGLNSKPSHRRKNGKKYRGQGKG
jgi:hypothetical protein